ncbi:MAG: endolytic transglycosylase MltG, partial [Acidobacteriota bacterium]|nr:endolytic transglycosylase MltG [Acidobacteriota bacterium]
EDFTVPEGSNIFDIANLLGSSDTVAPTEFLKAAADPEDIRDLDALAPSLEGYLFPSTYRVTHHTSARQLCHMMTLEFRKQWAALGGATASPDIHRTVTLASLVEKETAVTGERPLVAGVFLNRLRINMPLQCDPTTVYAALVENRYRGAIHKSDLASTNAYNTYAHPGLPPGPIANPGAASLKAAMHPADTGFLYFVAKGDGSGSHQFSSTIEEHERAVLAYRKIER